MLTVVFVTTGVSVYVVSTPRPPVVVEGLSVCPRRRAKDSWCRRLLCAAVVVLYMRAIHESGPSSRDRLHYFFSVDIFKINNDELIIFLARASSEIL